jgi:WD40 repeat protein
VLPNGKVLVAGGSLDWLTYPSRAELYDPATGTWTTNGAMTYPRTLHTATLLPNGKVLVAGGGGYSSMPSNAELYDLASGTWTVTGALHTPRELHTATLLPNGKVLVTGGRNNPGIVFSSAELYDPDTKVWTETGSLSTPRTSHTATLLPNGKVLVAGGSTNNIGDNIVASAELYDPASGTWTGTDAMNTPRVSHTATLLPSGKVLVAGGSWAGPLASTELYDSAGGTNPPPTLPCTKVMPSGACQTAFTNTIGAIFTALAATNPTLPISNWTMLGVVLELPPGQFQFTDPEATNSPRRFYRVRSP